MFVLLVLVSVIAACGPSPNSKSPTLLGPSGPPQADQPARTLVAVVQVEPKTLAARTFAQTNVSSNLSRRLFNADLALVDDQSNAFPYLAEALPQLNTDSWKVYPDGTMDTTYRLKPNLAWHDGTPLSADAFVFSWQLYSTPELGQASLLPIKVIARVEAPDQRTVLIRWAQPYAAAGALQSLGFSAPIGLPPLPRHILRPSLESGADALLNNPFWTSGYVGLGPFKLDQWQPGTFIAAAAFERHALGAPKIQQIKLMFVPDASTALANILAEDAQMTADSALGLQQAATLFRQWPAGRGAMVPNFIQWLAAHFQGRSDFVSPAALKDVRVRQAVAYAVDRAAINDALFDGQYPIADSVFAPTSDLGRAADAAANKYPFDLGRSERLMVEAGFTRAPGDIYLGLSGERFSAEVRTGSASNVEMQSALASGWRQAGFDFTEYVVPTAQSQDVQIKSTYSGIQLSATANGEPGLNSMGTGNVPTANNQWRGNAWDGYANPELDQLIAVFSVALDPSQRTRAAADIAKLYSVEVPAISLFFPFSPWVFTSDVSGPKLRPGENNVAWNVHEWEWSSR
jgi:peptide/nickel transport system substrate-binding protein